MTEEQNQGIEEQQPRQTPPPIPPQQQSTQSGEQNTYHQPQSQYGQSQYYGQGQRQYGGNIPPQDNYPPQNYMAINIVATVVGLLCCGNCFISMIIGIIGIVFASQVNSKFMMGDVRGAESSANTAKILGISSLILSGLTLIGTIAYYAFIINAAGGIDVFMETFREAMEQAQGY